MKFNPAKLQYKVSEVKYMGNIVSESGLKPDAEKVRAIIQMQPPQNREELQRFLGMVNYCSQFIPNQSVAAAFLCERGRENAELRLISPTNQTVFV